MIRVLVALLALATLAPSAAYAQSSSEVAAARALFREGLAAAREERWEEARQRFERSYAIAPRASTLLNLAGAQAETGQLVASAESYRRFLAEAQSGREARYRPQAEAALREVEARVAHVVLRVDGLTASDVVLLDGEPLSHAVLGIDLPIDPGTRTVVVRRGETEAARQEVAIAEGEHRELTLDASVDLSVTAPADPSPAEVALAEEPGMAPQQSDDTALWVGLGIGIGVLVVAAAAIGIGFAVDAANAPYSGNLGPGAIEFD